MKRSPASIASCPSNARSIRWRVLAKVMLAQLFSEWAVISAWPPASACNASRRRSDAVRRGPRGRGGVSMRMGVLGVSVHEMFHPRFGARARRAAAAQVEHELRIAHRQPAEHGGRDAGMA